MRKILNDQNGGIGIVLAIVFLAIGLAGAAGFGFWAFTERQSYKNDVDKKIAVAVEENTAKVKAEDAAAFAEEAKNPLKPYNGPDTYGSVRMLYPKTWSTYDNANGSAPVNLYIHPDIVPLTTGQTSTFALRVQVLQQRYDTAARSFDGPLKQGKVTVQPFTLAKVPSAVGIRVDGQLTQKTKGSMVLVPIRDKTLKVWTESENYIKDLNEIILPNLEFTP